MTDVITIKASSTLANGVGAHVNILVDGQKVGSTYIGSTTSTYSFDTTLTPNTAHDIEVVYNNDTIINGQDRNLFLDSISINGQAVSATSSYETYNAPTQGTFASDGNMYWNGTAHFKLPASFFPSTSGTSSTGSSSSSGGTSTSGGTSSSGGTSTSGGTASSGGTSTSTTPTDKITINASSSLANGVGAHVDVIVDGQQIGSTYIGSTASNYSFNTTLAPNTAHDIQVVYDNDAVINGQDRNLFLNSISVNGQTVSATSSYETYNAPTAGTFASDGNMYWNGTADFKLPASMFGSSTGSTTTTGSSTGSTTTGSSTGSTTTTPGFYVSTTGSSSGDGSSAHPFSSLQQAVTATEGSSIKTIYVEGGTYNIKSTVTLGSADSGITIESAPGSQAVLDGGGASQPLIQLNGASNVTLEGLTFQNTGSANLNSAVYLNGASSNTIVDNHFANNGEGLLLAGSSNNTVSGNELDNSTTSAIEAKNQSNGNVFDSNVINGTGALNTKGGGFFLHGANNNTISHNLVENTAGMGIGIENWDNNTINVGNTITNNVVMNANDSSATNDSGAIYELGRSQANTQSVISNNYVGGTAPGTHIEGIYLDDYTDGVQVTNNIVTGTSSSSNAVQIHGGSNVTVQNNTFDLGANGQSAVLFQSTSATSVSAALPMTNDVVQQNIIASTSSSPSAYSNISGGTPTISGNFYSDQVNSNFQTNGFAQTNPQYGNADFVSPSTGNYNLGSGTGAYSVGFTQIDQSTMGPHPTTAHWYGTLGNMFTA